MGIMTIKENLHCSDPDPTGYTNIVSKGFGVCTTVVERCTVLGQDLFGTDFSVVLFRPYCMLASEEHSVKTYKNQWLLTLLSPSDTPKGATNQRTHHVA